MTLFDDNQEEHLLPGGYSDPLFRFLNRSTRPAVVRIRNVCEDWYSRYPASDRDELRARFRDDNDTKHISAFFELFLHELLIRLACKDVCHPETANESTRHPDFHVTPQEGNPFYLEAVVVSGNTTQDKAAQDRIEQVYDVLNRIDSPNFFYI